MSTKTKKGKKFLTIKEAADALNCTEINVYYHLKNGGITSVEKSTYIQTEKGTFVATGESKQYITKESIDAKLTRKPAAKKGKQIVAKYVDGVSKKFKNGKREIVFPSESSAAVELEIGKFALRYRLESGKLIREEIRVSVLPTK